MKTNHQHIDQGMSVISSIGTETVARLGETLHGMWVCVPGTRCQVSVSVYQVPASGVGEPGRCLECAGAVRWMRQRGSIEKILNKLPLCLQGSGVVAQKLKPDAAPSHTWCIGVQLQFWQISSFVSALLFRSDRSSLTHRRVTAPLFFLFFEPH